MKSKKFTGGQVAVLFFTSLLITAVGVAGVIATYVNMQEALGQTGAAIGMVAAGEGVVVVCAFVALSLTMIGRHTPGPVRAGMWLVPLVAAGAGVSLAPNANMAVVMGLSPLAMTASGEGVALICRQVVSVSTGVDLESNRRAGLMVWHVRRAANGGAIGRRLSKAAVWRLTRQFAATDAQMSVQLGEVQRYRIGEGADANLAAVLSGSVTGPKRPRKAAAVQPVPQAPALPAAAVTAPVTDSSDDDGYDFVKGVLAEAQQNVADDDSVKLMTGAEVAAKLGVAPGTVRSWVQRKKLAVADRDADGKALFHPLAVDALG